MRQYLRDQLPVWPHKELCFLPSKSVEYYLKKKILLKTQAPWKVVLGEWEYKPQTGTKYLQNISDKLLLPKIYKEHFKLKIRKTNYLI